MWGTNAKISSGLCSTWKSSLTIIAYVMGNEGQTKEKDNHVESGQPSSEYLDTIGVSQRAVSGAMLTLQLCLVFPLLKRTSWLVGTTRVCVFAIVKTSSVYC